jgi:hypothetical protein
VAPAPPRGPAAAPGFFVRPARRSGIDFFGLSAKASGFPVEFVYPSVTTIVPVNVGIIAKAKNHKAAEAFVARPDR